MAGASNLALRVASAAVGLPVLAVLVWWRQPLAFGLFCLAAGGMALSEYVQLTLTNRSRAERIAVVGLGVAFSLALYFYPSLGLLWAMVTVILVSALQLGLARPEEMPGASMRLAATGFGIFYIGGLIVALPLLHRELEHGRLWVAIALAVTFASDTGAYFVGRALGRHKLAPAVSPGKTVEGAVGGLVAALGFLVVARATFFPALTWRDCALVGLAAGVVGPIGDLTESLIKRSAGAKDSGHLIPGHGGMLDRIDAVLFVGACVYLHVRLLR
jgi:phosphatidate cytidylyltransferase